MHLVEHEVLVDVHLVIGDTWHVRCRYHNIASKLKDVEQNEKTRHGLVRQPQLARMLRRMGQSAAKQSSR